MINSKLGLQITGNNHCPKPTMVSNVVVEKNMRKTRCPPKVPKKW
jgi:hypothetical protein